MTARPQQGFILIVVTGLAALMATMCLLMIVRSRHDRLAAEQVMAQAQARQMLAAACAYVLETARVGWDLSSQSSPTWQQRYSGVIGSPLAGTGSAFRLQPQLHPGPSPTVFPNDADNRVREETFGWVDVRDGQVGPKTLDYDGEGDFDLRYDPTPRLHVSNDGSISFSRPDWPAIGGICRAAMYRWTRPPFAISPTIAPNQIDVSDPSDPAFGVPLLRNPDPVPWVDGAQPPQPEDIFTSGGVDFLTHRRGDPRPVAGSMQRAWFRIRRDGPDTFTITVGAGGTLGFRDWDEVKALREEALFMGQQAFFVDALRREIRQWYRICWTPAVPVGDARGTIGIESSGHGGYLPDSQALPGYLPLRSSDNYGNRMRRSNPWRFPVMSQPGTNVVNHGGTLSWIQRLQGSPGEERW